MSGSSGMPTSLQLAPQFRNIGPSGRRDTLRPMNRISTAAMGFAHFSLDGEGFLEVRTTPGIGVALNEDVVKERTDPEFHPL